MNKLTNEQQKTMNEKLRFLSVYKVHIVLGGGGVLEYVLPHTYT